MRRGASAVSTSSEVPSSEPPDTEEIDFAWHESHSRLLRMQRPRSPSPPPRIVDALLPPREAMPTLNDEDPLRYDLCYDRERDVTRDSMPTIPDSDPLRHDVFEPT